MMGETGPYWSGSEEDWEGPCRETRSSHTCPAGFCMEGCVAVGCLSGGNVVSLSELVSDGRGCEMDRVGALCNSEGGVAKGRNLEGKFSGVLGGRGGPGDVFRSICAESVSGVDRGRGTADAVRGSAMRCREVEPDFRSMNRLNSYFARGSI